MFCICAGESRAADHVELAWAWHWAVPGEGEERGRLQQLHQGPRQDRDQPATRLWHQLLQSQVRWNPMEQQCTGYINCLYSESGSGSSMELYKLVAILSTAERQKLVRFKGLCKVFLISCKKRKSLDIPEGIGGFVRSKFEFSPFRYWTGEWSQTLKDNESGPIRILNNKEKSFIVLYSTLLHLPPLRFQCADGCWDRTQNRYYWCIG